MSPFRHWCGLENATSPIESGTLCSSLGPRAISILFEQCTIEPAVSVAMVHELCQFPGEYQRLAFGGFRLNSAACRGIFAAIERARCFRTVEMIAFDDIEAKTIAIEKVQAAVASVIRRCRFLHSASFGGWSPPLNLQPSLFANSNVLHEVHLTRQDMSHTFVNFVLPPHIHLLNFSGCHFTSNSFQRLFDVITKVRNPLVLKLADLQIPNLHWRTIWATLPSFPRITCVRELDWSGNELPADAIVAFADYFLRDSPVHFIGLDRIYRANTVSELSQLLSAFPLRKIWGLSIGGSSDRNFSGSIKSLLDALSVIPKLAILHINGQRLSDDDADDLLMYVASNREALVELSCDETLLSTSARFYDFYNRLDALNLQAIGRPFADLVRLFHKPAPEMPPEFDAFRTRLQTHRLVLERPGLLHVPPQSARLLQRRRSLHPARRVPSLRDD